MSKPKKSYLITYRARGNTNFALHNIILKASNVDDAKREFWKNHMKYNVYGEPVLTVLKIKYLKKDVDNEVTQHYVLNLNI